MDSFDMDRVDERSSGILFAQVSRITFNKQIKSKQLKNSSIKCTICVDDAQQTIDLSPVQASSDNHHAVSIMWGGTEEQTWYGRSQALLDIAEYFGPSQIKVSISCVRKPLLGKKDVSNVIGTCHGKLEHSIPQSWKGPAANSLFGHGVSSPGTTARQGALVQGSAALPLTMGTKTLTAAEEARLMREGAAKLQRVAYEFADRSGALELDLCYALVHGSLKKSNELHHAVVAGQLPLVQRLLGTGERSAVSAITRPSSDEVRVTPLEAAAKLGYSAIFRELRDTIPSRYLRTCMKTSNRRGMTIVHYAVESGDLDTLACALDLVNTITALSNRISTQRWSNLFGLAENEPPPCTTSSDLLDKKNDDGFTPLGLACALGSRPAIVKALVKGGGEVSLADVDKNTPLMHACRQNDTETARYLLSLRGTGPSLVTVRCKPNMPNNAGDLPVHVAARNGNAKLVRLLLNNGASLIPRGVDGCSVFHCAAKAGSLPVIKILAGWLFSKCPLEFDKPHLESWGIDFSNLHQPESNEPGEERVEETEGAVNSSTVTTSLRHKMKSGIRLSQRTAKVRQRAKSWVKRRRSSTSNADGQQQIPVSGDEEPVANERDEIRKTIGRGIGRDGRGGTGNRSVPVSVLLFRDWKGNRTASEVAEDGGRIEAAKLLARLESTARVLRQQWSGSRFAKEEYEEDPLYEYISEEEW